LKNIVFLAADLHIEYCLTILNGVFDFFKKLDDVHLIIAQVRSKNDLDGTFTYQSSMSIDMIRAQDIDGYILLSTSFGGFVNELVASIREKNSSPIISIGVELQDENSYSTKCNTTEIYKEIVGHFIKEHNCKKIGFFSANENKSQEALERFESYKSALKSFGMEYNPDYVLHGNFTRYYTKNVIAEKFKSKDEIPFDSIICANDLTASGCVEAFSALGVSIPDELKIIGFDDSFQTAFSEPSISSINQQIENQGYKASELIYNKLLGKEVEKQTEVLLEPVYRQSCGCVDCSSVIGVYRNRNGELINEHAHYADFIKGYYDKISDNRSIYILFDFLHSNETLDFFYQNIDAIRVHTGFKGMAICLYDKTIENNYGEEFELPESMHVGYICDKINDLRMQESYSYNPSKKIIPKELDNIPGFFILEPIYNCVKTYGYYLARFEEQKLETYCIYTKVIGQGIAQAAELSKSVEMNHLLEKEKDNLAKQSRTDELTKILNRRGFMEYGQQQINLSISMDTTGSVFFADLDGLKKINDQHGHKMGDLAIQLAAQALKASFRKADIVGRLSGDEFAVVATDMSLQLLMKARGKLDAACERLQIENNLPFKLSLSLGGTEYDAENYYLKDLLTKADEKLYEEKKRHHEKLGL